ncbi:MAG: hypothetical protein A2931_02030 [Candidatus Niyogibacteria bacterium RIFCSPLOWO2_01_FULL_45_48]|uniref:DedA family protein n=2 Tax=Candidatus Niyogiibacteriota TaxID=1817912 RepID=A0A1G2EZN7_9BACT|nr:MAG: hypothetical protein A2835_02635 [Candidatus Niyogibacteria bacterium RIFCSPHIGHO2_01_FULL_45_28]OGZ30674.1 MAG: hypothetical protein A2931_02030 [Candidatus Niyogibacteria bacterium RIFCSPLOWO2_01_FULL_45_48]OGZ31245.1 MAG: hypothetical protein A3J00_01730 [Candidatus Niyogibacteria bacterium RIFCSPLOWO2_02_FULL_45_13]
MARKSLKIILKLAVLVAILATAFYFAQVSRENEMVAELVYDYGYYGIFAVAVISGFNLAVPVPAIAFLPLFLESGLNFWSTIILITIGVTLADSFTYVIGRLGREVIDDKRKMIIALERAGERHWWAPMTLLFLFSAVVPLPNEILVVPLGFLNYRFGRIWPVILAGNFIFNFIYASGVINLFELV